MKICKFIAGPARIDRKPDSISLDSVQSNSECVTFLFFRLGQRAHRQNTENNPDGDQSDGPNDHVDDHHDAPEPNFASDDDFHRTRAKMNPYLRIVFLNFNGPIRAHII